MKLALLVLASIPLAGCDSRQKQSHETAHTVAVATLSQIKAKATTIPAINEISLVRISGTDIMTDKPKPDYIFTVRRDGTATKINFIPVKSRGTFHTVIPQEVFDGLSQFVESKRFNSYEPLYGAVADNIPEIMVSLVKDGKRKRVFDTGKPSESYEKEAPRSLKLIEERIDHVDANLDWRKISNDAQTPKGTFETHSGSY